MGLLPTALAKILVGSCREQGLDGGPCHGVQDALEPQAKSTDWAPKCCLDLTVVALAVPVYHCRIGSGIICLLG